MVEKLDISRARHSGEAWSLVMLLLITALSLLVIVISVFGLIWLVFFIILELFFHHLFMAFFRANSVQVTETQYPALYGLAEDYTQKLGLKKIPDIFIIQQTVLNAFATRVARRNVVVIYSHTVETMMEEDRTDALGMVLAHEMGHLAANHLRWGAIVGIVGIFLPPLYLYWSRCCEYTADRLAYLCLDNPHGAIEGLLKLTVGKKLTPFTNLKALAQQHAIVRKEFFVNITEIFSTHPHLLNRIYNLQEYAANNSLPIPTLRQEASI